MNIQIKYQGPHPAMVDFPTFAGVVVADSDYDTIEVTKDFFNQKLKQRKHNNRPLWVEVKKEKPKLSEPDELQPLDE